MIFLSLRSVPFGVSACVLASLAPAQMDPAQVGLGMVMPAAMQAQAERDAARLRKQGRLPTVSPAAANTRFKPSLVRRQAQAGRFTAGLAKANPEVAKSLAPAFRSDPVEYARPFLLRFGARPDDLADLTAVYLVSAWRGVHGKAGDPTRVEVASVRDQIRRIYASDPKLRRASNAAKQDVGEGSLYLAFLNDAFIETMKAHPEARARLVAEIASGTKAAFGLDLRTMRLTKAGLTN